KVKVKESNLALILSNEMHNRYDDYFMVELTVVREEKEEIKKFLEVSCEVEGQKLKVLVSHIYAANKISFANRREHRRLCLGKVDELVNEKKFSRGKKRTTPPGIHVAKRKRKSTYAFQNREKQKIRFLYGLKERQLYNLFAKLKNAPGNIGLVSTRRWSRQLVSQGHFLVNGKKVKAPNCQVEPNQIISFRKEKMAENKLIKASLEQNIKTPAYLALDKQKLTITYLRYPAAEELNKSIDTSLVVE
ncbi:2273_t:CDS:2, partial [Ambispora gerdemannii]